MTARMRDRLAWAAVLPQLLNGVAGRWVRSVLLLTVRSLKPVHQLGPRTLCNACGLVYAKMVRTIFAFGRKAILIILQIKKRFKDKTSNGTKKGNSGKHSGGKTKVLSSGIGGQMHVINPADDSADDDIEEEEEFMSQDRRSEVPS